MSRKFFLSVLSFSISAIFFSLSHSDTFKIKRVVDGDAVILVNGERVRLIGVDTSETKHPQKLVERFEKETYLFTKRMVEGKEVRLEYDWESKDSHGTMN